MREVIFTGCPVVSCAYIPAAEIPIPCWPRLWRRTWNFDPYRSFPNTFATWLRTMPGPLSVIARRKRSSASSSMTTEISGRIPASSQASSELSTASLVAVRRALAGLSKPRRCRFFWKNSATEISRWRRPIVSAVSRLRDVPAAPDFAAAPVFGAAGAGTETPAAAWSAISEASATSTGGSAAPLRAGLSFEAFFGALLPRSAPARNRSICTTFPPGRRGFGVFFTASTLAAFAFFTKSSLPCAEEPGRCSHGQTRCAERAIPEPRGL